MLNVVQVNKKLVANRWWTSDQFISHGDAMAWKRFFLLALTDFWMKNRASDLKRHDIRMRSLLCNGTLVSRKWVTTTVTVMMTSSNGNIFRVTGQLCGEFTGTGEFPTQRPVTRSFDVYFDLRPNKRLNKQLRGWWFETPSLPLWRHRNVLGHQYMLIHHLQVSI